MLLVIGLTEMEFWHTLFQGLMHKCWLRHKVFLTLPIHGTFSWRKSKFLVSSRFLTTPNKEKNSRLHYKELGIYLNFDDVLNQHERKFCCKDKQLNMYYNRMKIIYWLGFLTLS